MKPRRLGSYKRICCIVVVTILLSPQLAFSQISSLRIKRNFKGAQTKYSNNLNSIKSALIDSTLYYTTSFNQKKRIIYKNELNSNLVDSIVIEYKKKYREFFNERILSFSIQQDKFIFLCNNSIFIFKKNKENNFIFLKSIKNEYSFTNSYNLGNRILLYVCYNFHPEDVKNKHVWAILNSENFEIEQLKIQPDNDAIFGSLVNSWIDVNGEKICYSRSSKYLITIHDENFNLIDSIKTEEFDVNKAYVDSIRKKNLFSKDAISNLWKIDDSLLTRIRKVYYINDTTILALIKISGEQHLRLDIWQKTKGHWNRTYQEFSTIWYIEGNEYSNEKLTFTDFYQNVFSLVYNKNSLSFYLTYFPYIPTISTTSFNKKADYYDKQNDAIKNGELYFGIKEIKINIPNF